MELPFSYRQPTEERCALSGGSSWITTMAHILFDIKVVTVIFFFQLPLLNCPAEKGDIYFKIQGFMTPQVRVLSSLPKQRLTYAYFGAWQDLPDCPESRLSSAFLKVTAATSEIAPEQSAGGRFLMGRKSRTALLLMCCTTLDIRANSLVMMILSIYHGPNITWGALHVKPGCPQTSLAYGLIDGNNPDFLDFSPQQLVQDLQLTQSLAQDFRGDSKGLTCSQQEVCYGPFTSHSLLMFSLPTSHWEGGTVPLPFQLEST